MADRSSPDAQRAAFNDVAEALGRYLEALGWNVFVVGEPRIQREHGSRAFNFEFVVRFTAGHKP